MTTTQLNAPPTTLNLARIVLNTTSREAQRDLRSPAEMHRTLMGLLPENLDRNSAALLYRLDPGPKPTVLAQTHHPINIHALPACYATDTQTKDIGFVLQNLREGTPIRYKAFVNPTRSIFTKGSRRGARAPITNSQDALDWWAERAPQHGLHLLTADSNRLPDLHINREGPRATFYAYAFTGTAIITDPDMAHALVRHGIGRGKAWGLGLMSISAI